MDGVVIVIMLWMIVMVMVFGLPHNILLQENIMNINILLAHGLIKSIAFAVVIGTVACHQGLQTIGGPRGVGRSVTKSVVNAIVLILVLDYVLTRVMIHL